MNGLSGMEAEALNFRASSTLHVLLFLRAYVSVGVICAHSLFYSSASVKVRTRVYCHLCDTCYGQMIVLFLSPGQPLMYSSSVSSKAVELGWFKSICSTLRKKNHSCSLLMMGQQNGVTSMKKQFITVHGFVPSCYFFLVFEM